MTTVGTSIVLAEARDVLADCPGGKPRTALEFGALLVACAAADVSAVVQIDALGFPELTFDGVRRQLLERWFLASRRGEALDVDLMTIEDRVSGLWSSLQMRREVLAKQVERVQALLAPKIPAGLALDPHQLEVVARFVFGQHRLLVADDMGLGKTVEAMGCLLAVEDPLPALIACPASMVHTWRREAAKWLPALQVETHLVASGFKAADVERGRAVVVSSYDQMVGQQQELSKLKFRSFIADESHYLTDWDSQRTRTALRLRTHAVYRLLLSGTPMPNGRHREIYPQCKILDPDLFAHLSRQGGDRFAFLKRYGDPSVRFFGEKRVVSYDGRSNEAELGRTLSTVQVRRTKAEVGMGLPEKVRYALEVVLSVKDRLKLAALKDQIRSTLQRRASAILDEMLAKGHTFEAAKKHADKALLSEAMIEIAKLHAALGVLKADWSVDRVREHLDSGHRVLVFCYHHEVADHAHDVYGRAFGADRVRVATGALTGDARQAFLDEITAGAGSVVVLTRAYREGITLTSFTRGLMLQRWWVPGEEAQAEDRIHRRGQTRDVSWDYPIVRGSLDDAMGEVITWKERGQQQAFGSSESRAMSWILS